MDRKAEEETNGSAIRDDGRGPRDNRAAISWVAITQPAAWAVQTTSFTGH
jgi:hypothetical protein